MGAEGPAGKGPQHPCSTRLSLKELIFQNSAKKLKLPGGRTAAAGISARCRATVPGTHCCAGNQAWQGRGPNSANAAAENVF